MTEEQLLKFTKELGIARDQILREEAEMAILWDISQDKLSVNLAFYGGTALRLAYNSPRFSEDLDFLALKPTDYAAFKELLNKITARHTPNWKLADIKHKRQTMFALINIKDEKLKHHYSVKIEIHQPIKPPKLQTNLLLITSPTSILQPLLLAPTLSELRVLKENALANRQKARDLFDLWFIASKERQPFTPPKNTPNYPKREFTNDLQKFLPKQFWPIITQLYEQIDQKDSNHS